MKWKCRFEGKVRLFTNIKSMVFLKWIRVGTFFCILIVAIIWGWWSRSTLKYLYYLLQIVSSLKTTELNNEIGESFFCFKMGETWACWWKRLKTLDRGLPVRCLWKWAQWHPLPVWGTGRDRNRREGGQQVQTSKAWRSGVRIGGGFCSQAPVREVRGRWGELGSHNCVESGGANEMRYRKSSLNVINRESNPASPRANRYKQELSSEASHHGNKNFERNDLVRDPAVWGPSLCGHSPQLQLQSDDSTHVADREGHGVTAPLVPALSAAVWQACPGVPWKR